MQDLNSLEQFNHYHSIAPAQFAKSLMDFFRQNVQERLPYEARILDLGPGVRSLFEEINNLDKSLVRAVDFSPVAIDRARAFNSEISYEVKDITFPEVFEDQKYDLIFDSHCLHCIENPAARVSALKNIREALAENGLFAGEMMVQPAHGSVHFPMKYIPTARALEEEFINNGFRIIYFMIGKGLSFENENRECDLLRVIATKSS